MSDSPALDEGAQVGAEGIADGEDLYAAEPDVEPRPQLEPFGEGWGREGIESRLEFYVIAFKDDVISQTLTLISADKIPTPADVDRAHNVIRPHEEPSTKDARSPWIPWLTWMNGIASATSVGAFIQIAAGKAENVTAFAIVAAAAAVAAAILFSIRGYLVAPKEPSGIKPVRSSVRPPSAGDIPTPG